METTHGDLLMMFSLNGIQGIPASCSTEIDDGDKLNRQFVAGRYFEVTDFSLGLTLQDKESTAANANVSRRPFEDWRAMVSAKDSRTSDGLFICKPEPCSVTRLIDVASPVLFEHCARRQKFEKAIIIKRSNTGRSAGAVTFLRLEFGDVLITSLDWSEGDVVKESCRFTYKKLKLTYARRKGDGSAGESSGCEWPKPKR